LNWRVAQSISILLSFCKDVGKFPLSYLATQQASFPDLQLPALPSTGEGGAGTVRACGADFTP